MVAAGLSKRETVAVATDAAVAGFVALATLAGAALAIVVYMKLSAASDAAAERLMLLSQARRHVQQVLQRGISMGAWPSA